MPASKGSRFLTTRACVTTITTRQGQAAYGPSLSRTLTSHSRSEVGPTGRPAEQSVLVGQFANQDLRWIAKSPFSRADVFPVNPILRFELRIVRTPVAEHRV